MPFDWQRLDIHQNSHLPEGRRCCLRRDCYPLDPFGMSIHFTWRWTSPHVQMTFIDVPTCPYYIINQYKATRHIMIVDFHSCSTERKTAMSPEVAHGIHPWHGILWRGLSGPPKISTAESLGGRDAPGWDKSWEHHIENWHRNPLFSAGFLRLTFHCCFVSIDLVSISF